MSDITSAVQTILTQCLAVRSGEQVVVVTDPQRAAIARALTDEARAMGAEAVLIELAERATHGTEPPAPIAAAMLGADVLIAPTTKSLSHTEARRAACAKGARAATLPEITEDMLVRTMGIDYAPVRALAGRLAEVLTAGEHVRITSPAGTDVHLDIGSRSGIADDGDLQAPGAFGNLPAGEGFIAPLEAKAQGRVAFDGSLYPIGILEEPIVAEIRDGYIADLHGGRAAEFNALLEASGREAFAVAELGIGCNPAAKLTGVVLEDEKILGTIHIAFGDNHSFGGTIRVASHQDGVVLQPTVTIDDRVILEAGKLTL